MFLDNWRAYALSFERVLAEWDDGVHTNVKSASMQPLTGLMQVITYSYQLAETKAAELINMTATAEFDIDKITSVHSEAGESNGS
eukprot:SAG31_NODE_1297_length_8934_cov_26.567176_14_plen_85_part_00